MNDWIEANGYTHDWYQMSIICIICQCGARVMLHNDDDEECRCGRHYRNFTELQMREPNDQSE